VRIDAHQHFWRYEPVEYAWIGEGMELLRRDFLPADLEPELARAGFDGCVAVQARQTLEESRFLLALARESERVRGVVGWVDLRAPDVERDLAELAAEPLFKGVRHIVQDEPDDAFLLRPDFQRGIATLARLELSYDLLIYPRQLPAAVRFAGAFPEQRFVLDHCAKPAVGKGSLADWSARLGELAAHPNVCCKLSGLVTEAAWRKWKARDFAPVLDRAFEAFGAERVMFGSDWPVALLSADDYAAVLDVVEQWAARLSEDERTALFGGNAARFYRL
jgi:L-fuconolactonase